MKKIIILCICIILSGVGLFITSCILFSSSKQLFGWCIGLAAAMIILGLGYLVNVLIMSACNANSNQESFAKGAEYNSLVKERAGYLVCKIMNIILCIYLLILNEIGCEFIIMILGISLVTIQFLMDLLIQLYLLSRKDKDKE